MVGYLPHLYPIQNSLLYETEIYYRKFHKGQSKKRYNKASQYNFLKEKLKMFEEKLIDGYRQQTRGFPKWEPDIAFHAKLEKRSAQRMVIGELRD